MLPDICEFVMIMHDGVRLFYQNNQLIVDPKDGVLLADGPEDLAIEEVDTYDQGSRGFNYRTERLINRFRDEPNLSDLFSSNVFGDPATPVFEAYPGDPVTVRLVTPAERRRTHTFHLHGHFWKFEPGNLNTRINSFVGFNVMGRKADLQLIGGAGSLFNFPGDYMYRSGNIMWDIELGMWGIMRVHERLMKHLPPLEK